MYSLTHVSDERLLRDLAALVARDRQTTASLLAHIAEIDARRLFVPAGYASMHLYCVQELRLSEDAARKRVHAARAARHFPSIFPALADGRLHLSAVVLLAPYLSNENVEELLKAAAHKTKFEIEQVIAEYFPRLDTPATIQPIVSPGPAQPPFEERAPGRVEPPDQEPMMPATGVVSEPMRTVEPLAPRRFALQLTMSQELHDKLRYAQDLLSHRIPSGDVAQVLERVLDLAISRLERRKFAATNAPRRSQKVPCSDARYIPARVRCAVWKRDGGQCTFVSDVGHRCQERRFLEYDHVDPAARGGRSTVEGLRLRCRAHNQYAAEQVFGVEFMRNKRRAAGQARAIQAQAKREREAVVKAKTEEVIPWLRALGFKIDEARRAAERCTADPETSLEQRVRLALSAFGPRTASRPLPVAAG